MIDRIINQVIHQVIRRLVGSGVNAAMKAGSDAIANRGKRKQSFAEDQREIDQDPAQNERRRLHPDERKGDDVMYPTDDYTDGMQPRR